MTKGLISEEMTWQCLDRYFIKSSDSPPPPPPPNTHKPSWFQTNPCILRFKKKSLCTLDGTEHSYSCYSVVACNRLVEKWDDFSWPCELLVSSKGAARTESPTKDHTQRIDLSHTGSSRPYYKDPNPRRSQFFSCVCVQHLRFGRNNINLWGNWLISPSEERLHGSL